MNRWTGWSRAWIAGVLSLAVDSCAKPEGGQAIPGPLPEITSEMKPGDWNDLVFAIRGQEALRDGSHSLLALGRHKGREVGLVVVLGPKWKSATPDKDFSLQLYQGTVAYRSVGAASDALLEALDDLYGTKLHPRAFRTQTDFTAIGLGGNPSELEKGEVKIKLFFEAADENRYAELYTNIDVRDGLLRICEKDEEYRKAVVQALAKE